LRWIAFVEAVHLDLLGDHAQHRAVAQRTVAEVPAALHREGEVAAIGGAAVGAERGAQWHLALDVEIDAGVAELAVHPRARVTGPAEVAADRELGLVPVAAALAPVVPLLAI